ncbi:sugar ABC transporter permease [Rhodobacteraceae bacterium RKSG542]|uniref:carbohydrate ABC transporter permease n=1 Tax=Pseudovibrio flavus TaxID=2529854 RepID=UPI0012BB5FB4|nr:sugar ABC transporter permease [Pseudovibrio flavus]MTI15950.1 sugar ABC transporter permease [Pseudovibrio flavus]
MATVTTPMLPRRVHNALTDLALVGPATLAMLCLIFVPAVLVAVLSFTDYQFGAKAFNWIGLENYVELFTDRTGKRAVFNTLYYAAIVIPCSMILSLLVAMGVHQVASWNKTCANIFRTSFFLPVAATLVAMATVWEMLLHPTLGLVNIVLDMIGIGGERWLSDRKLVLTTLAAIGVWETVGYNMVLFLAGLASIPRHLYEAAEIDGADRGWERFWTVTWPMLGPTTLFVMVITATRSFRVFETVATLTKGGPAFASDTLVYAMYREGFIYFKAGYASAITMVFFIFVFALTMLKVVVAERKVHYR